MPHLSKLTNARLLSRFKVESCNILCIDRSDDCQMILYVFVRADFYHQRIIFLEILITYQTDIKMRNDEVLEALNIFETPHLL
jgi:hypothetical protein